MRRLAPGVLALLLLVPLLLAGLAAPALAAAGTTAAPTAGTTSTTSSTTTTTSTTGVHLVLQSLSPARLLPGGQLSVVVRVVNPTATALAGARVRLFVNSPVLTTRSAIAAWADDQGVQGGDRFTGVSGAERALTTPVPAGGSTEVTITVSADQLRLGSAWGARGVTVDVLDPSLTRLDAVRTFLVWTPTRATPPRADLTVLTPVVAGAPDLATGAPDPEHLASLTSPGGRLSRVVAAAGGTGATLVVDPAALGGTATGTTASTGTTGTTAAWQQQVAAAASGTSASALPLDDADLTSLASARAGDLYRTAVDQARARVAGVLGPQPAVLSWPVDGTLDDTALALATGAGTSAVVLSSSEVDAAPGRVALDGSGQRSRTPGVVVDTPTSAVLAAGTAQGSASGPALATARLLADAAVAARSGGDVVLATPRDWDPDPAAAHTVLAALAAAPWVRTASLTSLLDQAAAGLVEAPAQLSRSGQLPATELRRASAALAAVTPVAALVSAPEAFLAPFRERALAAASSSWRGQAAAWASGVAASTAQAQAAATGVSVVRGSPVTVISSRASLPVTLRNSLDRSVEVVVGLRSASLRLDPLATRTATIPASSQQRVLLPVKALASGDAKLVVVLSTTSGAKVGTGGPVQVRVRADWESRGVAVVGVLLALVLVVGIVRTVRRVRRGEAPRQAARQAARAAGRPAGRPPTGQRARQASHASGATRRPPADPRGESWSEQRPRQPEHHA